MTRVDEFNSFYSSTARDALRVSYALCGDLHMAHESTVDAYRRAWRDWSKVRDREPLSYVRNEAWKIISVNRSTHLLRRKVDEDGDIPLLTALSEMPGPDRRLIVLLTLGDTDLEQASREVDISAEDGIETVTTALDQLEQTLGTPLDQLENRLRALGSATGNLEMPPSADVRKAAQRGQVRNTVLLVTVALALLFGGGFVVAEGDGFFAQADMPHREKIGNESADVVLEARKLSDENLLTVQQVAQIKAGSSWKVVNTDEDVNSSQPYSTCPTRRFAQKKPIKAYVRTFSSSSKPQARAAQSIEVASTSQAANKAYLKTLSWYADCRHPRVQLVGSYVARRPFGDFNILQLRSHRKPDRYITVGFAHSGRVTLTLVHEVDGTTGPTVESFTSLLNASVAKICADSGGRCTDDATQIVTAPPPRASTAPPFLSVVDLPPIADIDRVWSAVPAYRPKENPAATVCEATDFAHRDVKALRSRVFVIPEARRLPAEFGIAETIAKFSTDKEAKAFIKKVRQRIEACPKDNLSANVKESHTISVPSFDAYAWRIGFEVSKNHTLENRTAIIRRGAFIAQLTFTPAGKYTMNSKTFEGLARRAGQRLFYAK